MRAKPLVIGATVAGLAAAPVAARATLHRSLRKVHLRPDPFYNEEFGSLRGTPAEITADDGARLYAEIDNPERTDLAIVFSHGWTLNHDSWHFQRKAMRHLGRLVFWDHRGHGKSEPGADSSHSIPQLGRDLRAVIEQTVPGGTPVVLIGHSMGGMTVMRFADDYPDWIGSRVAGAGLVCTSSGLVQGLSFGLPSIPTAILWKLWPTILSALRHSGSLIERRHLLRSTGLPLLVQQGMIFDPGAGATVIRLAQDMMAQANIRTLVNLAEAFSLVTDLATCIPLRDIDLTIIAGETDKLTALADSLTIASYCPDAHLEVIPRIGHMAQLERHTVVTQRLTELVERVRASLPADRPAERSWDQPDGRYLSSLTAMAQT